MNPKKKPKTSPWVRKTLWALIIITAAAVGVLAGMSAHLGPGDVPAYNEEAGTESPVPGSPAIDEDLLRMADSDRIFPGISINGTDVSGLTEAEAVQRIAPELEKTVAGKSVSFTGDGRSYVFGFVELGFGWDVGAAAREAFEYGRKGSLDERYKLLAELRDGKKTDFGVKETHGANGSEPGDMMRAAFDSFAPDFVVEPVIQSIARENGEFRIIPGRAGVSLDLAKMTASVIKTFESGKSGTVAIELISYNPPENTIDMSKATDLLGTFNTSFAGSSAGRRQNITTAASKLDGTLIMPGEIFSTNDCFGDMTYENGYAIGQAIVNGELVDDIGGGVCQVSSTLYVALLYAELEIVQRQNHSQRVSYMDWAYDATLYSPHIDLKFKNDTDYPVIVESFIQDGNKVIVNIYGNEKHSPGRRLVFENAMDSSVPPPAEEVIEDPLLPLGEREVVTAAKTGYKYFLYKLVYENDVFIEKVLVNTSNYRALRGVVRVGTGEALAEPPVQPVEPPFETTPPNPEITDPGPELPFVALPEEDEN